MSSFLEEKIQKRYSSARAIRKTALRANCGYRRCFTHEQALTSYRCPLAKTCKHVCFLYTVWLNPIFPFPHIFLLTANILSGNIAL